jgi:hypothetical protein
MNKNVIYQNDFVLVKHVGNTLVFKHPSAKIYYGTLTLAGYETSDVWRNIAEAMQNKSVDESQEDRESTTINTTVRPANRKK